MGFKDDMVADLDVFFDTSEFAIVATYTPASGTAYSIKGFFDGAYESLDPNSGASVMSTQPKFQTAEAYLKSTPGPEDTLTINGKTYKIRDKQPDGVGLVDFLLTEEDDA